ncbi:mitochondrial ribosomal protein L23 [Armillaria novae-zelandiae]|uniref:Large ribosomal subunit protein uL23m n=1 Tax=Armillaria novae-zelandiae TaxID=153914 RepID=A0AA39PT21_9AGAR|nr:mitochondrial ribosomal protein L23 [Armillaria novae-zelandiae]
MPEAALIARTASTPIAVRARREKKTGRVIKPGETDATFLGLTPSDHARYLRRKAQGLLSHRGGDESEKKWHERQNKQRSRIRGIRKVTRDGKQEVEIVGQTIYLPNVIFRLVRNNTPPEEPYNPYEATFRIPLSITKTDIRSYLLAVYGVKTTYIRTDIYRPAVPRRGAPQTKTAYKRTVVGLVEPFYYPHRMEGMDEQAKEERTKRLEDAFQVAEGRETQKLMFLKLTRELSTNNKIKNPMAMTRAAILARVSERRKLRESTVENTIQLEDLNKPISPPTTPATPP